jgi:hypothetical protein
MKNNLDRFDLKINTLQQLFTHYKKSRKPILVKNAFHDSKISSIKNQKSFQKHFGEMIIPVTMEYSRALHTNYFEKEQPTFVDTYLEHNFNKEPILRRGYTTINEYFAYVKTDYSTPLLCPEVMLPESMDDLIAIPENIRGDKKHNDDYWMNFFLGNKGNYAHLHYDWNVGINLFFQIFGKKRITLFSPEQTPKMLPFSNIGGFFLENMTEPEKQGFKQYAQAEVDITIGPGEALLIPPLYWHHIEYTDSGASLNFRFGSNRLGSWLTSNFYKDPMMQMYLHEVLKSGNLGNDEKKLLRALKEVYGLTGKDQKAGFKTSQDLMIELFSYRLKTLENRLLTYSPAHPICETLSFMHYQEVGNHEFAKMVGTENGIINQRKTMNHVFEASENLEDILKAY